MLYGIAYLPLLLELTFLTITVTRTPTKEVEPRTDLSFAVLIAIGLTLVVVGHLIIRKKHKEGGTTNSLIEKYVLKQIRWNR